MFHYSIAEAVMLGVILMTNEELNKLADNILESAENGVGVSIDLSNEELIDALILRIASDTSKKIRAVAARNTSVDISLSLGMSCQIIFATLATCFDCFGPEIGGEIKQKIEKNFASAVNNARTQGLQAWMEDNNLN